MYPGDIFPAIISQISAAANVWNSVSTSSIRLAYGGFYSPGTTESAPGIQIEFSDDIPPGLLALQLPTSFGCNLATAPNGTFHSHHSFGDACCRAIPSATYFSGPSYSEEFFVTLVHEFGHTLGLQHTLASSVMSTITTTAATKANPLGADDIAGISLLYPAANYLSTVGSISGTGDDERSGPEPGFRGCDFAQQSSHRHAHQSGRHVSDQRNSAGREWLEYYVYVHPLPAPLEGEGTPDNIFYPHNSAGVFLAPDTGFATQFYPSTQNPGPSNLILVQPGAVTQNINFSVSPSSSAGISSVRTYTSVTGTNNYITSGTPLIAAETTTIAAYGAGLLQPYNSSSTSYSITPGLSVSVLGSAAQTSNLRPYLPPNPYVAVDVSVSSFAGTGPKHLMFSTPGNLYVLPAGFTVVDQPPPVISALAPTTDSSGNPAVFIAGLQFMPNTQILFDGVPAVVESQSSNSLTRHSAAAPPGYTASIAALNPDGQSSLFYKPAAPTFTYASPAGSAVTAAGPSLVVSPSVIPAGGSVTLTIQGTGTNFTPGVTTVGFGTSDVLVTQVNVISPTQLTVNVTPNATVSSANITITTGLEVISQALGSPITATDPQQ